MAKMYLLVKVSYGDFDVQQEEVIGASPSCQTIDATVSFYNATRTADEISSEIKYKRETTRIIEGF